MDNALKSEINLPLERFYWLFIDFSPFTFELDLVFYKQQNVVKAFMKVCSLLNLQFVNCQFWKDYNYVIKDFGFFFFVKSKGYFITNTI